MAKPIVPTRVALSSGLPVTTVSPTTEVTYIGHTLTNAQLAALAGLTTITFLTATSVSTAKTRKQITIYAAADGAGGHFGSDNTVTDSSGHFVFPGTYLTMTGYNGAIWAIVPTGAQTQRFYIQET